jgi:tellurite resistance protein TerB
MTKDSLYRPQIAEALLRHEIEHALNVEFMEALVAACAIVSWADGEVSQAERRRVMTIARSHPRLSAFSHSELGEEFASHTATFRIDPEVAREMAREKLQPFGDGGQDAALILEAARQVIPADGVAHPAEYRALGKLRHRLGLDRISTDRGEVALGYAP